jgi:O-antigen/teichoic acid export membrane protein
VGWYGVRRAQTLCRERKKELLVIFRYSLICAGITLIIMLAIWGTTFPMLFNPAADFENFGHPMILFDPRISFIGWLVLMIIISPLLQLMTSIFSAFITLMTAKSETLKE